MDYPVRVWYGVNFSGEDADKPAMPDSLLGAVVMTAELRRAGYEGIPLIWVSFDGHYGLGIAESSCCIQQAKDLAHYPEDLLDTWAMQLAGALALLGVETAKFAWYNADGAEL